MISLWRGKDHGFRTYGEGRVGTLGQTIMIKGEKLEVMSQETNA